MVKLMSEFLIKLFVKNKDNPSDGKVRSAYLSLASFTGIIVNILLFVGKLVLGLLAASVAIIADAFNNISDAGSAVIALIGFRLAEKPIDKEHPLGHGRLEYITGFIVDLLIILVGFELLKGSIEKIMTSALPNVGNVTLVLLIVAIFVKFWLFLFYSKIAKRTSSATVKASAVDSLTDCIATTLVLVSALVARFFGVAIDGWAGILVAAFIMYSGIKAAKETIDLLLGSPPDPAFIEDIYGFVKGYEYVVGIHDVMVHDYGPGRQIVSFHAEVPSDADINAAHEEVDKLESDMHKKFGCIVTVHLDPIVLNDPLVNELREIAESAAKQVDERFSIHDFRMTKGETHINLIFDLVMYADCKLSQKEAVNAVCENVKARRENCNCVIRAEYPFI
jgi:cation diffusion facilitator family transporter